jgi:hypothetical protein
MSNQYLRARITGRDAILRAADVDREQVADRLRTSHAEGRLDMDEFQQRLERCYEAKTLGELGELVSDLPRHDVQAEHRSIGWLRPWRWRLAPLVPMMIAVIVVSAAIGHHMFWLWIPIVFLFWRISWLQRRRWWVGGRRGPDGWI